MAFNYGNYPAYNPAYTPANPYGGQMMQPPPQMPAQMPQTPQTQLQGISPSSRPVTNREEALGIAADFSGNLMLFPDITHNRIYLKRWNFQSGSADFDEYAPVQKSAPEAKAPTAFASLQDFQNLQDTVESLQKEIERLKKPVGKPVKKNDASDE